MRIHCVLIACVAVAITHVEGLVLRTPATKAYLKASSDWKNAVQGGGFYALEKKASRALAENNFKELKPHLPKTLDVVKAGGWDTVKALAADPKGAMMELVNESVHGIPSPSGVTMEHLDAIVALLQAEGKGFESELVDGDWVLVLKSQQGKPKTKKRLRFLNRLLKREKLLSTSDFDVSKLEFYGTVPVLKWGRLSSTVKYTPTGINFEKIHNKTVLRRVVCAIQGVSWKFGKLPKLNFSLKSNGYLDFLYLDHDLRVTRGNRGGLFVHMRPDKV